VQEEPKAIGGMSFQPQFEWSYMTCDAFGVPARLERCWNTYSSSVVTAEAAGSSPIVRAIPFNG